MSLGTASLHAVFAGKKLESRVNLFCSSLCPSHSATSVTNTVSDRLQCDLQLRLGIHAEFLEHARNNTHDSPAGLNQDYNGHEEFEDLSKYAISLSVVLQPGTLASSRSRIFVSILFLQPSEN